MYRSYIFSIKQICVLIFLILNATGAHAQLDSVARSTDGNDIYYVERSSIRREGNVLKLWMFSDKREPEVATNRRIYFSTKAYTFFNCRNSTYRFDALIGYSKNMWQGDVVINDQKNPDPTWYQVVPGSSLAVIFRYACG